MSLSRSGGRVASMRAPGRLGSLDPILLLTSLALAAFGILAVYVAGASDRQAYALNQAIGFGVGVFAAVPLAVLDYRRLQKYMWWFYGAVIVMLLAVTVTGATAKGAQRWINVGPVQVQPSEFAKLLMVIVLAAFISERHLGDNKVFLKALGLIALPALLVFAQPDLGTALVFGALFITMSFIGGGRLYQLGTLIGAGVAVFAMAVKLHILQEYQVQRLTAFLQPGISSEINYQVLQSKMAIGSGGLMGKGLGATTLANLGFLPEDHTDFIFSNLAERVGFVGSFLLLGLFFILIWRILHIAAISRDKFGMLLAVGIGTIFLFQVFVNIGMTMGIMPVTGIPLPFISYGRSSLVVSMISLGLLQSIAMRSRLEVSKNADL